MRLAPAPMTAERARVLAATLQSADGRPLNLFAVLAHNPSVLRRVSALGGALVSSDRITAADREAVILRVAARLACDYEWHHHVRPAQDAGLSIDEIDLLRDADGRALAGTRYGLLAAMTDELLSDGAVSDTTWAALATVYDEGQLVELIVLVGFYRMLAGFIRSAGIAVEGRGRTPAD